MGWFLQDLKQAVRIFRLSPGFTLTAVAALAIGIGANTAVFSVLDAVLLRPVAAPDSDRVVALMASNRTGSTNVASDIKFNMWRAQTGVLEQVSGYYTSWFNLTGVDRPQQVDAVAVTRDYFPLFGLSLARGRAFSDEEERLDNARVAILSYAFWRSSFGGDPGTVGRTISLSGVPYEVVGILAPHTRTETPTAPDVWIPFAVDPASQNQVHYFVGVGRLKPGVSLARANAQAQLATAEFRRQYPKSLATSRDEIFSVQPLRDVLVRDVRPTLFILGGAVAFVLLIACANVANLLLARAGARRHEMAIRAAVGASRGRIVRQLLTENGLLAAVGAVLGLGLGLAGIRAILALDAANLPRIGLHGANVTLDWRIVLFTGVVALATGLLFGLAPAARIGRLDLYTSLKESGIRGGASLRAGRTRSLLVVGEVAVALILLMGAVLLIRTLVALRAVNPGFDPHRVAATMVTLDPRYARTVGVDPIAEDIHRRLTALPGVENAALTGMLPLEGNFNSLTIVIPGRPLTGPSHGNARWMIVSPAYFDTLRIPLLRGRLFTDADRRGGPPVAIVNQAMARQFWPGADPLRDRLVIGMGLGQDFGEPSRRIVGVVGDVREDALNQQPLPAVFIPATQRVDRSSADPRSIRRMWVVVRTREDSPALGRAIENELRQATGGLPVAPLRRMESIVSRSAASQELNMILMSVFGGFSVLLAAIGIYGLLAHSVQQRSREMAIRVALGARPADVRNMVVLQGLRLTLTGAAAGTAAAFGLTRYIASLLFGVKPLDPVAFAMAPICLVAVALVSAWVPALRASRVDPAETLRSE